MAENCRLLMIAGGALVSVAAMIFGVCAGVIRAAGGTVPESVMMAAVCVLIPALIAFYAGAFWQLAVDRRVT